MSRRNDVMYRRVLMVVATVVFSALACSCMWGVVRDSQTGQPVVGASVTFFDSKGNTRSAITDANGVYAFNSTSESPAAVGEVGFVVQGPNSEMVTSGRSVDYGDNPGASLSNMSSFWEVQSFDVGPGKGKYRDTIQGFTATFPEDWMIEPMPVPGGDPESSVLLAGPMLSEWKDAAFCIVASARLSEGDEPEDVWLPISTDMQIVREGKTNMAGQTAVRKVYRDSGHNIEGIAFIFRRDDQAWAIDCITPYGRLSPMTSVFDGIAKSFQFTR
jgi:hypothetical protein